jgi:integrase/recombinase XerD
MSREPWKITRELFLDEKEADALRSYVVSCEAAGPEAFTDRVIIETLMMSGLRNSELCGLRLKDVDCSRSNPKLHVAGTPRQDRTVYIPGELAQLLKRFIKEVRPLRPDGDFESDDPIGPLILNERGRRYDRTSIYRRVVRILSDAGFESRASVQLLRHTYGYLAYRNTGGNLLFVQRQLGHAHPMVTAIYAEFVEESYADLADRVADSRSAGRR